MRDGLKRSPGLLRACGALFAAVLLAGDVDAQVERLEAQVDSVFAQYDNTRSPGCALGVIREGQHIFKRGYGMANLEYGIPNSPSRSFA